MALVPTFYLYGEPHRLVEESFVHCEALDDRSRPSEWTIKPHAHAELAHIFVIASGGGAMAVDGETMEFAAPCLLLVPATMVHGFHWLEESSGSVVTIAMQFATELTRHDPDLAALLLRPAVAALGDQAEEAQRLAAQLVREVSWCAPGQRAAVSAALTQLLVLALRRSALPASAPPVPSPHVVTVARLRERIEQRFRLRETVAAYAEACGVSETALRVACARVAGVSPAAMLDNRALLEAKRALLYSNLTVGEIAFSVGFTDAAYFSRFFARHTGQSPRAFRTSRGAAPG